MFRLIRLNEVQYADSEFRRDKLLAEEMCIRDRVKLDDSQSTYYGECFFREEIRKVVRL